MRRRRATPVVAVPRRAPATTIPGPRRSCSTDRRRRSRDFIDAPGKARWYKFAVTPGQRIDIKLSGLPADYDLAVFKDIGQAFASQFNPATARDQRPAQAHGRVRAVDRSARRCSVRRRSVPSTFSPDAYSPSTFSPSTFSPVGVQPVDVQSVDVQPVDLQPVDVQSVDVLAVDVQPVDVQSVDVLAVDLQRDGDRAGVLDRADAKHRRDLRHRGPERRGDRREHVEPHRLFLRPGHGPRRRLQHEQPVHADRDEGRDDLRGRHRHRADAAAGGAGLRLEDGAAHRLVEGRARRRARRARRAGRCAASSRRSPRAAKSAVSSSTSPAMRRVKALRQQAANNPACPFAKNLVAEEIKGIVDAYRANPLQYVVLVGNDDAIPFFRSPDQSAIGQESGYVPPVQSNSPSEASLRRDFVLSQDRYGSKTSISLPWNDFPVPGLAVGRLVETTTEIAGLIDAYVAADAVVSPHTSLVTGYDFLEDAANAVKSELDAGTGAAGDALITPNGTSPQAPASWTAAQLAHEAVRVAPRRDLPRRALQRQQRARRRLRDQRAHDRPRGLDDGLHQLDRLQRRLPRRLQPGRRRRHPRRDASARLGAGLRPEEGDADRGHRLPVRRHRLPRVQRAALQQFRAAAARRRAGTPIAVGEALVQAKLAYLAATPDIRGLHEKALLEATLFGLPMLAREHARRPRRDPRHRGRDRSGAGRRRSGRDARPADLRPRRRAEPHAAHADAHESQRRSRHHGRPG